MCRSLDQGGRRCPGGHDGSKANQAARQRLSRSRRALTAARDSGDTEAIAAALVKLNKAETIMNDVREAERSPVAVTGGDVTPAAAAPPPPAGSTSTTPADDVPATPLTAAPKRRTSAGKRSTRKAAATTPTSNPAAPEPTAKPALAPVSGRLLDQPLSENGWGYNPKLPISYHDDGPIGSAVRGMGAEARMDVDGEPLGDVLGKVATDVIMGRRTPQEGLDEYKTIRDRLPEGSRARSRLDWAIRDVDAPTRPAPVVPDSTPEPLRRLVTELNAIPMVRKDGKELDVLTSLLNDYDAGRIGGSRMIDQVRRLDDYRHESFGDSGKFTIYWAVRRATDELNEIGPRNLYRR